MNKQGALGARWKAGELGKQATARLCASFNRKNKGRGTDASLEIERNPLVLHLGPFETGASHLAPADNLSQLGKGGGDGVWRRRACLSC